MLKNEGKIVDYSPGGSLRMIASYSNLFMLDG